MGTFGDEFINLRSVLDEVSPTRRSDIIDSAITALIREGTGAKGGYLYFPPGVYALARGFIAWAPITVIFAPGAVIIPPIGTADPTSSEPNEADIQILGSLQVGLHQFIMPPYVPANGDMRDAMQNHFRGILRNPSFTLGTVHTEIPRMGRLLFETDRVTEVFPEWWGAESFWGENADGLRSRFYRGVTSPPSWFTGHEMDFVDSTAALQACLDAAHRHRGGAVSRPAIPVVLSGRYLVSKHLLLGRRIAGRDATPNDLEASNEARLTKSFVLRGRAGPGNTEVPSLEAHPNYPPAPRREDDGVPGATTVPVLSPDNTLLLVHGPSAFLIENVAFHGRDTNEVLRAFSCLRVERFHNETVRSMPPPGTPSGGGDQQMARVKRCAFVDAYACLVQLGDYEFPYQDRATMEPPNRFNQDILGLVFEGCRFLQTVPGWPEPATVTAPTTPVWPPPDVRVMRATQYLRDGVYFRASQSLMLHFLDGWWHGPMRAGIRTYGGRLTLTNCNFHLGRLPVPHTHAAVQDARYTPMGMMMAGADPRLTVRLPSASSGGVTAFTDARDNGCDVYLEWIGVSEPTPGVYARGVESQSARFLATFPWTGAIDAMMMSPSARVGVSKPNFDVHLEQVRHGATTEGGFFPGASTRDLDELSMAVTLPPGIEWSGPCSAGATLHMQDVQVGASIEETRMLRGRVAILEKRSVSRAVVIVRVPRRDLTQPDALANSDPYSRVVDLGVRVNLGVPPTTTLDTPAIFSGVGIMGGVLPVVQRSTHPWYLPLYEVPSAMRAP